MTVNELYYKVLNLLEADDEIQADSFAIYYDNNKNFRAVFDYSQCKESFGVDLFQCTFTAMSLDEMASGIVRCIRARLGLDWRK